MALNVLLYCEDGYVSKHLQTLLSEENRIFSVFHFSERTKAEDYLTKSGSKIRCILASEDLIEKLDSDALLSIRIDDTTRLAPENGAGCSVNVFQHKKAVMEDILSVLRAHNLVADTKRKSDEDVRVISFFSTQGGSGRSTLSYLSAVKSAETGKTVYLNLESAPCTETLYQAKPAVNAEEFLFALQDRSGAQAMTASLGCNEHGVYVFPTVGSLQDRAALTKADVSYLLDALMRSDDIQTIIVDLDNCLGEIESYVLENSNRVVMMYNDDSMGSAKRRALENDPNYATYPFAGREFWAGNRCKSEYKDGRYQVCFPVSNSLAAISDLRAVLIGNPAFSNGCKTILALDE